MAAPHLELSLPQQKREARQRALAARAGCDPAWGARLAEGVLAERPPPAGAAVAGFWPMGREIDIRPLLVALHERGHKVLLPVTPQLGNPLSFRVWTPGAPLRHEKFGTHCPMPEAPEGVPDLLLVPLVAFDRAGRRLGYGGGFYDRTLAALPRATALGCAYAAQELDAVPADEHDVRLPAIATERGIITCVLS